MRIYSLETGAIGTNTYIAVDQKSKVGFIVDPGAYSPDLKSMIDESGADMAYIILTHGHADHIMGVPELVENIPDVKIVASEREKDMLNNKELNMSIQFGKPTEIDADIYVKDGEQINVGSMNLTFLSTPGHSPGCMCIYIPEENILFSGDTLFRGSIGRTDFPGSSFQSLISSVKEKILPLPDETDVFPGHMGATDIGLEKRSNPFLQV